MPVSLKVVFVLICVGSVCLAQTDAASAPGSAPATKGVTGGDNAPVPANPPLASPSVAAQDPPTPGATGTSPSQPVPQSAVLPPVQQPAPAADPVPKADTTLAQDTSALKGGKRYVIGPLDVLLIRVWNNANLTSPYDVGSDGILSMPLIGEIKADGLTREQLKEVIKQRLGEFLNSPEVDIQIGKVNSKRYFVYGGVLRSGEFPLIQDTTVMDALSLVGGFKDFANTKKIYVQRGAKKFDFNYKDVSKGKHLEQDILLENGDRIVVPE